MGTFYKRPSYTKNQTDTLIDSASSSLQSQLTDYVHLSGDTMTGDLNIPDTLNVATLSGYQSDVILPANNTVIGSHALPLSSIHAKSFSFEPQATEPSNEEGAIYYDDSDKTLTMVSDIADARLQIGQELWIRVKNTEVDQLDNGTVVYASSGQGGITYVKRAQADTEDTSATTLAVITHDIAAGDEGYATGFGLVRNIDTSMWNEGDTLYLSPLSAGKMTNTIPVAPYHTCVIGHNINTHASNGIALISIQNGWELYELHDAYYDPNTILDGNMLAYNSLSSRWEDTSAIQVTDSTVTINRDISANGSSYYGIGWRDLTADLNTAVIQAGLPAPVNFVGNTRVLAFKVDDAVQAVYHIDHDYLAGSTIYPHVHWAARDESKDWCAWQMELVAGKGHTQGTDSVFTSISTVVVEQSGTGRAFEHQIAEYAPGVSSDLIETDALVFMVITRIAATSGSDIGLVSGQGGVCGTYADIHFQSTKNVTVNKAPPFD